LKDQGNNMQLVAIQMTSTDDVSQNLAMVGAQLAKIEFQQPSLVLLPENFAVFTHRKKYQQCAEPLSFGTVQTQLANWAKQYNIWLVAGSFPISADNDELTRDDGYVENRTFTTSLVFNPAGELIQHYHKLHLFDAAVSTADKQTVYRESDCFKFGEQTAMFTADHIKFGMTICYDLRFPELFRQLRQQGADVILVPAAFTAITGEAHWLTLLRARAIENQCYILAANQVGQHSNNLSLENKSTWGHSVIIDPWGQVITQIDTAIGHISAPIDIQKLVQIRADMPILQHARFTTSLKNKE